MSDPAAPPPRCPRCSEAIQPDWDWCHACGYDPLGLREIEGAGAPSTADPRPADDGRRPADAARPSSASPMPPTPPRRNVYDPDAHGARVSPRVALLAGVLVVGVIAAAVAIQLVRRDDGGSPATLGVDPVTFERGITPVGDGWTRIEIDEGAVTVELPGPLLRTRDDLLIGGFGELPVAVWGGGAAGQEVWAVGLADVPGDWQDRWDELLASVPLPVGVDVLESERTATEVAGRPAVEIEANGPDGQLRAVVVATDDQLVILLYGSRSPVGTAPTIDRMRDSLAFT